MRPQAALLVTLAAAVAFVLAGLPLISSAAASGVGEGWPCCNQCGVCNRKMPPECRCLDISYQGCNAACKNCVKYTSADDSPVYRCADVLTNFCQSRCTPTVAATVA